jgi:penicillin-binding protein-related factor A (putative recombinase)
MTVNFSSLDDVTYQKTVFFVLIAVKTSNVTYFAKSETTFTFVDTCEREEDFQRACNLLCSTKFANSDFSYKMEIIG